MPFKESHCDLYLDPQEVIYSIHTIFSRKQNIYIFDLEKNIHFYSSHTPSQYFYPSI